MWGRSSGRHLMLQLFPWLEEATTLAALGRGGPSEPADLIPVPYPLEFFLPHKQGWYHGWAAGAISESQVSQKVLQIWHLVLGHRHSCLLALQPGVASLGPITHLTPGQLSCQPRISRPRDLEDSFRLPTSG